jgi:anti-sigma-K factor RskA
MSAMETHGEFRELVASYVIGAVPEDEAARIRTHISTCAECRAEAESLARVTSSLDLAVAPEAVPEGFADRVMARASADSVSRPVPRRRWTLAAALAAAALVALAAVAGGAWLDARSDLARNERIIAALLDSRDGLNLAGAGDAVGKVVPRSEGGSVFVARGLEPVSGDRTYQLWLMTGSCEEPTAPSCTIRNGGTFRPEDGIAVLTSARPWRGYSRAAVTIEPRGGSARPTTDPVMISA